MQGMLKLKRSKGEKIIIGHNVVITIVISQSTVALIAVFCPIWRRNPLSPS
jgi:sRNA-binding carbon storage regulator CsrA